MKEWFGYFNYLKRQINRRIYGKSITKKKIREFLEQEGFSYTTVIGVNEVSNGLYEGELLRVEVRKKFVAIESIVGSRWARHIPYYLCCLDFFDEDWDVFEREFRVKRRGLEALIGLEKI